MVFYLHSVIALGRKKGGIFLYRRSRLGKQFLRLFEQLLLLKTNEKKGRKERKTRGRKKTRRAVPVVCFLMSFFFYLLLCICFVFLPYPLATPATHAASSWGTSGFLETHVRISPASLASTLQNFVRHSIPSSRPLADRIVWIALGTQTSGLGSSPQAVTRQPFLTRMSAGMPCAGSTAAI